MTEQNTEEFQQDYNKGLEISSGLNSYLEAQARLAEISNPGIAAEFSGFHSRLGKFLGGASIPAAYFTAEDGQQLKAAHKASGLEDEAALETSGNLIVV